MYYFKKMLVYIKCYQYHLKAPCFYLLLSSFLRPSASLSSPPSTPPFLFHLFPQGHLFFLTSCFHRPWCRNYQTHDKHCLGVFPLRHRRKADGKNTPSSRVRLCLHLLKRVFSLCRPTENVPMATKCGHGCLSIIYKTGQNKGRKSIWRMAELLLRKPVEEGIPPSPFSGLKKMTLTHGRSAKTYELTQAEGTTADTPLAVSWGTFTWDSCSAKTWSF